MFGRAVLLLAAALALLLVFPGAASAQIAGGAPVVSGISPSRGPVAGGTSVTIRGSNFVDVNSVNFAEAGPATFFVVQDANTILATSPPGAGTVDITVTSVSGTSAANTADRFTYVDTAVKLSSSPNPSASGQAVTFTASVDGIAPTGSIEILDGGTVIGVINLVGGATSGSLTIASLSRGVHSITAHYLGDANNLSTFSAALLQAVGVTFDTVRLRTLQTTATPIVSRISGQGIIAATGAAIDAAFGGSPEGATPNGSGVTFNIPLDGGAGGGGGTGAGSPAGGTGGAGGTRSIISGGAAGGGVGGTGGAGGGSGAGGSGGAGLAGGGQGGNGAPPGTRLIDMGGIPLPPGSGMPPPGEDRFAVDEVVLQFAPEVTQQQITAFAERFGLTLLSQQTVALVGRSAYTFKITGGQSVREMIALLEASGVKLAVQPNYTYGLTQDQAKPTPAGDPAQYIVGKLRLPEVHRISRGENVVIAVIDSEIDSGQPDLAGSVRERFDAGCGNSTPDAHGTGMAGAIASHGKLLGVAPEAKIIAVCAFAAVGRPESSSIKVIRGLDYAIQRGARIVNMSFAGARDPALAQALQIARERGVLLVAAAGNAGPKSRPLFPGADPNVMAITATDQNDQLLGVANRGRYIALAAPGVDVLVPAPGTGIQFTTGTSVATANVSGVAALLLARKPSLKPEEIRSILVRSAQHLGPPGINPQYGAGLVDPLAALTILATAQAPGADARQVLASIDPAPARVGDAFAALGYAAGDRPRAVAVPMKPAQRVWIAWVDLRGTEMTTNPAASDLRGTQVNATAGLTRMITPDFLVGALGGYERFDFRSQSVNGIIKGDGWTGGGYLGWRFAPALRFDATAAWSSVFVDNVAGAASGSFTGQRLLASLGFTGTWTWKALTVEPSLRVYKLWEHENAYTDSLGIAQAARSFETGRVSGGARAGYSFSASPQITIAPYLGIYGDYYFTRDDALAGTPATVPLLEGWSGRAVGGVEATFAGGAQIGLGGEYGGIGANTHLWTWRARGRVPF